MRPSHPWKVRLLVGIIMLTLAIIGMAVTDIRTAGGWDYWKWMVPIYAILALWLSWYVKRQQQKVTPVLFWHEVLHWVGLICAIFLVSYLVHLGTISRFVAGVFQLILLSLAVFLAGVYIETTFIVIGLALGAFALMTAAFVQYVYALIIPIVIAAVAINVMVVWYLHKKFKLDRRK